MAFFKLARRIIDNSLKPWGYAEARVVNLWQPSALTNLVLWLDADDASTLTLDGSDNVEQWDDKSGNTNHVTQTTTGERPSYEVDTENSKSSILFDRNNNTALVLPSNFGIVDGTSEFSFVVLFRNLTHPTSDSWQENPSIIGFRDEYNWHFGFGDQGGAGDPDAVTIRRETSTSGWGNIFVSPSLIEGNFYFAVITYSPSSGWTWSINGGETDSGANSATQTFTAGTDGSQIGGLVGGINRHFDGYIPEVMLFGKTLTSEEVEKIEGYLAYKWGLAGNLPAAHPYKDSAP